MESTAIQSMVDNILSNNEAGAFDNFKSAMADKLTTALDNRKQEIAASLGKKEEDEAVQ